MRPAGLHLARGPAPAPHPGASDQPRGNAHSDFTTVRSHRPRDRAGEPGRPGPGHPGGSPAPHPRRGGEHGDDPALCSARSTRLLVRQVRRRRPSRARSRLVRVGLQQRPGFEGRRARRHANHSCDVGLRRGRARRPEDPEYVERQRAGRASPTCASSYASSEAMSGSRSPATCRDRSPFERAGSSWRRSITSPGFWR